MRTASASSAYRLRRILGIPFLAERSAYVQAAAWEAGLTVVPSGPGLESLPRDHAYRTAVEGADRALTDSGLLVICWGLLTGEWLPRTSGLRLLKEALQNAPDRFGEGCLWVMPHAEEMVRTQALLRTRQIPFDPAKNFYHAPHYPRQAIADPGLLDHIRTHQPHLVVICLGGNVQEVLGAYLRDRLDPCPAIWCTGAASAFLTGGQAPIGTWIDRLMLGWLWRILHRPDVFLRRYLRAVPLIWKLAREARQTRAQ